MDTWKSFEEIFNANKPEMLQTGDSGEDVGRIWNAVLEAAKLGVEERVIFCIIMQESTGNVGVGTTTDNDITATGGLMQAEESPAFPGQHNLTQVRFPCDESKMRAKVLMLVLDRIKLPPWLWQVQSILSKI
jgi:hypothetical protein